MADKTLEMFWQLLNDKICNLLNDHLNMMKGARYKHYLHIQL